MEVEEPDFKEIIIPKIKKSTQDLVMIPKEIV